MARLNNSARKTRAGTISIVTLVAMLALVMLIGFVGNAGHAVNRKIEAQNAADAAAMASSQWMARGMNAITATNHLLGEVTAILTIHEALGGPEVDAGIEALPAESSAATSAINTIKSFAPIKGLPTYVPPQLTTADEKFINFVANQVAPENSTHRAFGTIYDAKMTLKKELAKQLVHKGLANFGLFVPPPWGYGTAAAAYAKHLHSTKVIMEITKEWFFLEALEEIVVQTKGLKVTVLEEQLVPALAEHAELVASLEDDSESTDVPDLTLGGLVGNAIQHALHRFEEQAPVALTTFPRPIAIRLPVEAEPKPSLQPGQDEVEWNTVSDDDSLGINLLQVQQKLFRRKLKMRGRINKLKRQIRILDKQETDVNKLLENAEPDSEREKTLKEELIEIDDLRTSKRERLAKTENGLAKTIAEESNLVDSVERYESLRGGRGGNLSEKHLPAGYLNQPEERYTQWVRATYPYVDALRAPIISQFERHLRRSNARKHFIKWTNRYTLVKSWQFRSGYRFGKTGPESGAWSKTQDARPLHMYVMKNTYDQAGVLRKGNEPWTKATADGKKSAEKLFTIIGLAHRDFEPLYAPRIYPQPQDDGITTYAQAIVYNANPQDVTKRDRRDMNQPKVGWDTLNWDPEADTPEWGADATEGEAKWPWQIISAARQIDSVKVKLNWQAKLMPVTQTRIAQAAADNATNKVGKVLKLSMLNFEDMSSH